MPGGEMPAPRTGTAGRNLMAPGADMSASKEASGTAWQPASTPMFGTQRATGPWTLMFHYNAFLSYVDQGGARGAQQGNAIGWAMLMARRKLGPGDLMLRAMLSPEPFTAGGSGYPLIFQTGESWRGHALHDRQHPHDLFMELATRYQVTLGRGTHVSLYGGLPGEPALGPVAFPHRTSALDFPIAPISHHWQDSTHITFGVLTAGIGSDRWQVEGSWFKGREPNENRYNIDTPSLDSWAGRLTLNPSQDWSLSASHGFIKSPEQLNPTEDVRRTVVSVMHNRRRADGGNCATTTVWGRNNVPGHGSTDSWLLESSLNLANRNTVFGRFEHVVKTGSELVAGLPDRRYSLQALTLGVSHELTRHARMQTALGFALTYNVAPASLRSVYGRHPLGLWVFLRVRPAAMGMAMGPSASPMSRGGMSH